MHTFSRLLKIIFPTVILFGMVYSQNKEKKIRVLFIFDVSRSMSGKWENATKMDKAKVLFNRLIDSLSQNKNYTFALRLFGHTVKYPPGNCQDTRLVVPFNTPNSIAIMKEKVSRVKPTGITPIEHSLTEAGRDFPDTKQTNVIILITDGIEECGGDPCRAKEYLVRKGIELKPFIIGIGLTPEQIQAYHCVGKFMDSEQPNLSREIHQVIHEYQTLKTTFQVNLLDSRGKPSETNVNMTFWDSLMNRYSYNLLHTLNYAGVPDTLSLPVRKVKIQAHTIPPVFSEYREIYPGMHNIIPLSAPQGSLKVTRPDGIFNQNRNLKYIVRKEGEPNTIHVQPVNTTEKYITGNYDLEILTLPRIYKYGVTIEQSKLHEIRIPNDGQLIVKSTEPGDGCILQQTGRGLQWVINLQRKTLQEFYLQPGEYVLVWRSQKLRSSIYTIEKNFTIKPDQSLTVELFK